MEPDSATKLRWGLCTAAAALVVMFVIAFVPDLLGRQRVITATLDQVDAITEGTPVFFRGAQVGAVRSITLIPARRTFEVRLGLRKDWQASECTFLMVSATNPMAQPRLDVQALETPRARCLDAMVDAGCIAVPPGGTEGERLTGCQRPPDLIALASAAIVETATVARKANLMMADIDKMLGKSQDFDVVAVARSLQKSVGSLNAILANIDGSLAPGRGDVAVTLTNVRQASQQAAKIDVEGLNQTIGSLRGTLADNRAAIARILEDGQAVTAQSRALLQATQADLVSTSAALSRTVEHLDTLTERAKGDPGFVVRGTRFTDPSPPGAKP